MSPLPVFLHTVFFSAGSAAYLTPIPWYPGGYIAQLSLSLQEIKAIKGFIYLYLEQILLLHTFYLAEPPQIQGQKHFLHRDAGVLSALRIFPLIFIY